MTTTPLMGPVTRLSPDTTVHRVRAVSPCHGRRWDLRLFIGLLVVSLWGHAPAAGPTTRRRHRRPESEFGRQLPNARRDDAGHQPLLRGRRAALSCSRITRVGSFARCFHSHMTDSGMGPGFGVQSQVERTLRVVRGWRGVIVAIGLQRSGEDELIARTDGRWRAGNHIHERGCSTGGHAVDAFHAGAAPCDHSLTRLGTAYVYLFGPYPRFFASLGFAVLMYDKRSAGRSTDSFFTRAAIYPKPYLEDAVAAVRFLATRSDINPRKIGLWGTSEGGMLTTQVAAVQT